MIIVNGYYPFSSVPGLLTFKRLFILLFSVCGCFVYAAHVCSAQERQKRASNFLKLEIQIAVSLHIGLGGLESRMSGRVASALTTEPSLHGMKLKLASNFWSPSECWHDSHVPSCPAWIVDLSHRLICGGRCHPGSYWLICTFQTEFEVRPFWPSSVRYHARS